VAKFIIPTPLPILILYKPSFSVVDLKMSSMPTLALKSHSKMFIWYLAVLPNACSNFI
jgi:hypothetical protein